MERPHVLVVDDDPEFLGFVRDGLAGAQVVVAHTPVEALWLLEHQAFQAVVCDLVLRSVDGRHVLDVVRERWPSTARILVTGFGDQLDDDAPDEETLRSAQAIVYKPCDLEALGQLVAALPGAA
jgi:CheY-like chemotaxis protein